MDDFQTVSQDVQFSTASEAYVSSHKEMFRQLDGQVLCRHLSKFLQDVMSGAWDQSWSNPAALTEIKGLVKDPDRFELFLASAGFQKDQFFELSVYICPEIYNFHLIKFIRSNYFNK